MVKIGEPKTRKLGKLNENRGKYPITYTGNCFGNGGLEKIVPRL